MNNNWPPKHAGEHNPEGRTGNKNWDKPGLKGREDETYAKAAMSNVNSDTGGMNFMDKMANVLINRDEGRDKK